jgi:hypothetical protein
MEVKCCNRLCDTKFCPHCGRQVHGDFDLDGLLAFLRNHQRGKEKELKTRQSEGHSDYHVRLAQRNAQKWKTWADLLEGLIARLQTS